MSPAGDPQTHQEQHLEHVTCLGCGCACDDIGLRVADSRIVETANACALGREWFGDGVIPAAVRLHHTDSTLEPAVDAILAMLAKAAAPLIYLAPELSCEAQREAVALADLLHASLDTISSDTVLSSLLAAQERGRASATLGEIRNRADVLLFWGVDPVSRYPRYGSRYAPEPIGLHVDGRRGRTVIAVDVDDARGPAEADLRVAVSGRDEVALLTAITAIIRKPGLVFDEPLGARASSLATTLVAARYSAVVSDAEPAPANRNEGDPPWRDSQRGSALIALAQALNGPSRCALSTLRGGGNRSGAEAVLTSQTGFPTGVDFSRGFPVYRPHDAKVGIDAVLILGDAAKIPPAVMSTFADLGGFARLPVAVIGPGASHLTAAGVAIDTGVAGIHCGGTALRMDDVALPLRPSIGGHRDPAEVIRALIHRGAALVSPSSVTPSRVAPGPFLNEARSTR
jgi:formylmethanofuran dehydrogenase subunit B